MTLNNPADGAAGVSHTVLLTCVKYTSLVQQKAWLEQKACGFIHSLALNLPGKITALFPAEVINSVYSFFIPTPPGTFWNLSCGSKQYRGEIVKIPVIV